MASLNNSDNIILFDAVCKLCCGWTRFILRFDKRQHFKLCSVQSPAGQELLRHCGLPTDSFETMVLIQGSEHRIKSDALLTILVMLPWPWPLSSVFKVVPVSLRNTLYDRLARNRYKLFGQYDQCMLPRAEDKDRFLQ